jgi:YbbR domain-containing protein
LNLSFAPVILDITRLIPHAEETEPLSYTIRTSDLLNRISSQISNEITILEVHPGSIVLILDSLETKQVPVEADIQIDFAEQYNLSAPLQIIPEQVLATGPGSLLDTLESVSTVHKTFRAIKKTTEEELELVAPEKVTLKPRKAKVIIPAEEFTEKILKIPVKILDKPNDTDIKLFPSELEVSFRVALSQYTAINATDFLLAIPFSAIRSGHPNVQVTLEKKPDFVRDIKYFPQTIEYLIEKE